jgi:MFS family permease
MANGVKVRRKRRKKSEVPLPMLQVVTIVMCTTSWFISALVIFPFVPFAVQRLFPKLKRTQLGSRTGLLDGAFFIGLLVGGIVMGWASDKYGRRPILLWGTFTCTFFSILFGIVISLSFEGALVCRFVWGCLSANALVGRAMLSELTDSSNRSRAFGMIGLGPSVGSLIGGGFGGILAEPADKYPFLDIKFFRYYPYALPVFAAGFVNLISWLLGYLYLPETLKSKIAENEHSSSGRTEVSETEPLLAKVIEVKSRPKLKNPMMKILTNILVIKTLTITFLGSFCHAFYLTIIPLWALNAYDDWGFNLGTTAIGILRLASLPSDLLLLLWLYPKLLRRIAPTTSCKVFGVCWTLVFLLTPLVSYANRDGDIIIWMLLILVVTCNNGLASCCNSSDGVVLGNSVESDVRGRLYGYRQSMIGLARFGGSIAGGWIFSWSFNNRFGFFPFNFFFSWIILALLMIVYTVVSFHLPWMLNFDPIERRKSLTISVELM